MTRSIPWPRLGAEFVVIVVGVLVALGADSWWQGRADAAQEAAQIAALLADFEESRERLEEVTARQRRVVEDGAAFLRYLDGSVNLDEVGDVYSFYRFEPVLGAYRAMVSSGDVTRLSNQDLVRRLAAFSADVDAGFEDEAESSELLVEMIRIMSDLGADILMPESFNRLGLQQEARVPPSAYRKPAFETALAFRTILEWNRLNEYGLYAEQINEIMRLLESEASP